ncbi:MAG TPA: 3-deoxy-D-manno-octulosonic acid transferase [Epsilonproteobacteria bacterium]|nr:3-deoxy-D-manno-octulosonic acid transferase [Campylobacterota bacterium]
MFLSLYTLVTFVAWVVALPFLFIAQFKTKHRKAIPARFFLKNNPSLKPQGVWIHACSFGEAKAIKPLVDSIPKEDIRLSITTQTGYLQMLEYSKTQTRYLPFEPLLWLWTKKQKMLIVVEAELWYLLFAIAKKNGTKTLLVNARINTKSYPRYQRFAWLYRQIFKYIDGVYAQTPEDAKRLTSLGAKDVKVMGNIKFALIQKPTKQFLKPKGLLICAASTHKKEEALILHAFRTLKSKKPDAILVIAPRHPERFESVDQLIQGYAKLQKWSYHRYTQNNSFNSDVILLDTLGELINLYAISDVVVLGGAFEPIGGHNAAEAAQFGCPIISGEHYFNQKEIFGGIEGITIVSNEMLGETLQYPKLLSPTKIKAKADIKSIQEQIKNVL